MAKRNEIPAMYLFLGGSIVFGLAWMMPSFPLLGFLGFAPFVAIVANDKKENSLWNHLELVLLGLAISFLAATFFNFQRLVDVALWSIAYTLPFLGLAFVRKTLGEGVSLLTLILFWLSVEYLLLKWNPTHIYYLADLVSLKSDWVRWNTSTGYLGASLWILSANYLFYRGLLSTGKVNFAFLALFIVTVAGPIIYSYSLDNDPISREQMIGLYALGAEDSHGAYNLRGEFIPRTSLWVSVLIVLFTFVKKKINRKK